jgi:hypothetical protein
MTPIESRALLSLKRINHREFDTMPPRSLRDQRDTPRRVARPTPRGLRAWIFEGLGLGSRPPKIGRLRSAGSSPSRS